MINHSQERRKHRRLDNNIALKISGSDADIVTETRNLSCSGAYCKVDKSLELMAKLKIHLLLPFKKNKKTTTKRVSCQGVVVRVDPQPQSDFCYAAIYFNDISEKDRKHIEDYIESVLAPKTS
ncbi:MAG: PilZ domain-containing protein [Candidatus Omnitrophota bacterium]